MSCGPLKAELEPRRHGSSSAIAASSLDTPMMNCRRCELSIDQDQLAIIDWRRIPIMQWWSGKVSQILIAVCTTERERFKHEIVRLRAFPVRVLMVKSDWPTIERGEWRSKATPSVVIGSLLGSAHDGVPFILAGNRERRGKANSARYFFRQLEIVRRKYQLCCSNPRNGDYRRMSQSKKSLELLDQAPPNDLVAENAVIAIILLQPERFCEVSAVLSLDDLYDVPNRTFYGAMLRLQQKQRPPDLTLLIGELRDADEYNADNGISAARLCELYRNYPLACYLNYYVARVLGCHGAGTRTSAQIATFSRAATGGRMGRNCHRLRFPGQRRRCVASTQGKGAARMTVAVQIWARAANRDHRRLVIAQFNGQEHRDRIDTNSAAPFPRPLY